MSQRVLRMFSRSGIDSTELLYLRREERRTVLTKLDGTETATFIPLKEILEELPEDRFWNIQKGVAVSGAHVVNIDDDGVYTMVDGTTFQGRRRNLSEHRKRRRQMDAAKENAESQLPASLLEKCTLMDDAPIAFCVIELVFEGAGKGIDFIFRYCNKEMAVVEGVPVPEMQDRSFYEVFPNGDLKWIVPYADVALNGTRRIIRDFSPEIGKDLVISCFQPEPGYCGCFLQVAKTEEWEKQEREGRRG